MNRLFCFALVLSFGCGDGEGDCTDAASCPADASIPESDAANVCFDADCDDDLFCNGVERCVDGACAAGENPCDDGVTCDEARDECVPCEVDDDGDDDGHASTECGGDDCDDADADRFPDNPEDCDDHDEDCRVGTFGDTDADEDGYVSNACCNPDGGAMLCGDDCDDGDAGSHPNAEETCDGENNDCDATTDEAPAAESCSLAAAIPACVDGACAIADCDPGFDDCDGTISNGCEVDTRSDLAHCGGCDRTCDLINASETCNDGNCERTMCDGGFGDCSPADEDCETALDTPMNCGGCGVGCELSHAVETCATESCAIGTCDSGWGNCDGDVGTGCETSTVTTSNCGDCDVLCDFTNGTAECDAGTTCRLTGCDAGWGNCDFLESTGCERRLNTPTHCGACARGCSVTDGTPGCEVTNVTTGAARCIVSDCDFGFCDFDGAYGTGCEYELNTDPSCSSAASVGSVNGDTGGTGSAITVTGRAEQWFAVRVDENDTDDPEDLIAHVSLTDVSGGYVMYVRCPSCSGSETLATTSRSFTKNDIFVPGVPIDDTFWLYIEVAYVLSDEPTTCPSWTVTIDGDVAGPAGTPTTSCD